MKVALHGHQGPLAAAARAGLERKGHVCVAGEADVLVFFPGSESELDSALKQARYSRIVLRSHALAYGPDPKNYGMMDEGRVSLLEHDHPERRWLRMEERVAEGPSWAALRFTNILDAGEKDLIVEHLSRPSAMPLAGVDPNVQFISLQDAARAVVCAVESAANGVFNIAGGGAVPLKQAYKAAGTRRLAMLEPLTGLGRKADLINFNWTISGAKAERELGFRPEKDSVEALREFAAKKPGGNPGALKDRYDDWGLGLEYIRAWEAWFTFVRTKYWRIDCEGMENVPRQGRGLFIANHRGFVPIDAVMHLYNVQHHAQRTIRFLIIHSLLRKPFLANFLTKLGGVIASMETAARLLEQESLVGVFPEGIRGTFTPYKATYKLRDFSRSGYVEMALIHQAPIIPAAVIGHSEIFPIIGRIDSSWVTKDLGWPYFPIAPPFPLVPIPFPSKWHIRILPRIGLQGLKPADAENARIVREFSRYIQDLMQKNIDDMVSRRKHIFWGKILDGTRPQVEPFQPSARAVGNSGD